MHRRSVHFVTALHLDDVVLDGVTVGFGWSPPDFRDGRFFGNVRSFGTVRNVSESFEQEQRAVRTVNGIRRAPDVRLDAVGVLQPKTEQVHGLDAQIADAEIVKFIGFRRFRPADNFPLLGTSANDFHLQRVPEDEQIFKKYFL